MNLPIGGLARSTARVRWRTKIAAAAMPIPTAKRAAPRRGDFGMLSFTYLRREWRIPNLQNGVTIAMSAAKPYTLGGIYRTVFALVRGFTSMLLSDVAATRTGCVIQSV